MHTAFLWIKSLTTKVGGIYLTGLPTSLLPVYFFNATGDIISGRRALHSRPRPECLNCLKNELARCIRFFHLLLFPSDLPQLVMTEKRKAMNLQQWIGPIIFLPFFDTNLSISLDFDNRLQIRLLKWECKFALLPGRTFPLFNTNQVFVANKTFPLLQQLFSFVNMCYELKQMQTCNNLVFPVFANC